MPPSTAQISLRELFVLFLKIGLSFGAGTGMSAVLQEELVKKRKAIARGEFMTLYGLARLVPSGSMTALAVPIGYRYQPISRHGGGADRDDPAGVLRHCPADDRLHPVDRERPFSLARVTPGQANLYVASIAYMMFGLPGAALSMVVIALPSYLMIPLLRSHNLVRRTRTFAV